jgi:hypothetical protein
MEHEETLKASALIGTLSNSIKEEVNDLFAQEVVASSVAIGGILFAVDEVFRVEKFFVGASSDLVHAGRFEINVNSSRNELACL